MGALIATWILVGWCGTGWPRRFPWPPPPPPEPWLTKAISLVGGVVGGYAYTYLWPMSQTITGVEVAASAVGAFIGAVVLGDLYALARGSMKAG